LKFAGYPTILFLLTVVASIDSFVSIVMMKSMPFLNREVWFDGYFQHILPNETISEEKKMIHFGMCYYIISKNI
jgi:hypothetical protein